jgi:hypothetical protein
VCSYVTTLRSEVTAGKVAILSLGRKWGTLLSSPTSPWLSGLANPAGCWMHSGAGTLRWMHEDLEFTSINILGGASRQGGLQAGGS